MAIYTPTGLKVRIPVEYAFGLLGRLHPRVGPFRVLKTTEGIELIPSTLALMIAVPCFALKVHFIYIGIATFIAYNIGGFFNRRGWYFIPLLVSLSTLHSYVAVFGISTVITIVIAFLLAGWQSAVAFIVGKIAGYIVCEALEFATMKKTWARWGQYLPDSFGMTASERHFFNAYRLHALRLGVTTDISLSKKELKRGKWQRAYLHFARGWPKVVARFTEQPRISEIRHGRTRRKRKGRKQAPQRPVVSKPERTIPGCHQHHQADEELRKPGGVIGGEYRGRTEQRAEMPAVGEKTAEFWNDKGVNLRSLGRYQEAIECYDKALQIDPRNADAWNSRGNSLNCLGRYHEAIECLDKALEISPRFTLAWTNKAVSLGLLGRHHEAIECLDKALQIDPRHAVAWSNRGNILQAFGRHQEAIDCYDKALKINPQLAAAWYNRGISLQAFGRHQEAIHCYDKALDIDPQYADAWNNRGNGLIALGRYQEAIDCLDRALEIDPRLALAWFNKALAEDITENRRGAARSYPNFVELASPQHADQIAYALRRLRELK